MLLIERTMVTGKKHKCSVLFRQTW